MQMQQHTSTFLVGLVQRKVFNLGDGLVDFGFVVVVLCFPPFLFFLSLWFAEEAWRPLFDGPGLIVVVEALVPVLLRLLL